MRTTRRLVASTIAGGLAVAGAFATAAPATAHKNGHGHGPAVRVVAQGLEGPFGIARYGSGFLVAESGRGQVTAVDHKGRKWAVVKKAPGVAGVTTDRSHIYSVTGEGENERGMFPHSAVLKTSEKKHRNHHKTHKGHYYKTRVLADLLKYELRHNPDGQVQFVDGQPVDALSNPFAMTNSKRGLLVADGGANDVLLVNPRTGKVRTFFVPPTVKDVPFCLTPEAQANPGTIGCDPVPTGVTVVGNSVYVSTLGAEVPGAGRIYKLDLWTGKVKRVWKGLTAPTGIAVDRDGTIYYSQVLEGAPEGDGPPAPDFDPSTVGQITKISKHGKVSTAQVTMPTGLLLDRGTLYSSAWSIAGFLGIPEAGQIVKVSGHAFKKAPKM